MAARGDRADEDMRVGAVLAHAHPVAEDGAAALRARRIDRQRRHPHVTRAQGADHRADQGGLARAGRPGQADDRRLPPVLLQRLQQLAGLLAADIGQGERPGQRTGFARAQAVGESRDIGPGRTGPFRGGPFRGGPRVHQPGIPSGPTASTSAPWCTRSTAASMSGAI